jgi:hypothetical protein
MKHYEGCIERDDLWNENQAQIWQAWRIQNVPQSLCEVTTLVIIHHSIIMTFHENPLMWTIVA